MSRTRRRWLTASMIAVLGLLEMPLLRGLENPVVHEDQWKQAVLPAIGIFSGDANPHQFLYGAPTIYYLHLLLRAHYVVLRAAGHYGIESVSDYVAYFLVDPVPSLLVASVGIWCLRVLALACVFGATRKLAGWPAACTALGVAALDPIGRGRALTLSPDMPVLATGAALVWWIARKPPRASRPWRDLGAGLLIGVGAVTKSVCIMFVPAYVVWRLWFAEDGRVWGRRFGAAVGLAGVVAGFVLASPYVLFARDEFMASMIRQAEYHQVHHYRQFGGAILHAVGNLSFPGRGVGPVAFLSFMIGCAHAIRGGRPRQAFAVVAACSGFVVLGLQTYFQRNWLLPLIAPVAVLAAIGVASTARWAAGALASGRLASARATTWTQRPTRSRTRGVVGGVLTAAVLLPLAYGPSVHAIRSVTAAPGRTPYVWYSCQSWLESNITPGEAILLVVESGYAPRLLATRDSPPQPRDAYLGRDSRATRFLHDCQDVARAKWGRLKPSYRLFWQLGPSGASVVNREQTGGTEPSPKDSDTSTWRPLGWYVGQGVTTVVVDKSIRETTARRKDAAAAQFFSELEHDATRALDLPATSDRYPGMEVWTVSGAVPSGPAN